MPITKQSLINDMILVISSYPKDDKDTDALILWENYRDLIYKRIDEHIHLLVLPNKNQND